MIDVDRYLCWYMYMWRFCHILPLKVVCNADRVTTVPDTPYTHTRTHTRTHAHTHTHRLKLTSRQIVWRSTRRQSPFWVQRSTRPRRCCGLSGMRPRGSVKRCVLWPTRRRGRTSSLRHTCSLSPSSSTCLPHWTLSRI